MAECQEYDKAEVDKFLLEVIRRNNAQLDEAQINDQEEERDRT
jgi:hypothetical protein